MRAYFFGNFYLSSIQQGIQAQHCTAEMFVKYSVSGESLTKRSHLYDWAENHKTSILLNGGDTDGLYNIREMMYDTTNLYPWAYFRESQSALNQALTCVGIILPERVYEAVAWVPADQVLGLSFWEIRMAEALKACGMAR